MTTHEFTIIASGLDAEADDFEDRFFAAGCDDATISFQKGAIILEFAREASSFAKALVSAFADVLRAGAEVERIEPDYLVSLSDIAERSGMSRAAISLYTKGARGRDFPAPVARVTSDSPLWDWSDVSRWMLHHKKLSPNDVFKARLVKEANLIAQGRELKRDQRIRQLARRAAALSNVKSSIKLEVQA